MGQDLPFPTVLIRVGHGVENSRSGSLVGHPQDCVRSDLPA